MGVRRSDGLVTPQWNNPKNTHPRKRGAHEVSRLRTRLIFPFVDSLSDSFGLFLYLRLELLKGGRSKSGMLLFFVAEAFAVIEHFCRGVGRIESDPPFGSVNQMGRITAVAGALVSKSSPFVRARFLWGDQSPPSFPYCSTFKIFFRHSAGPTSWTETPELSTATVTGISFTSNS